MEKIEVLYYIFSAKRQYRLPTQMKDELEVVSRDVAPSFTTVNFVKWTIKGVRK